MRNFQGQNFISRLNFQTAKHHKQAFRQQIKPELFEKLQVSENPSANYMNAYKRVYKDELQKTMEQHYNKKIKDEYQNSNDKMAYSLNPMNISRCKDQTMVNSTVQQQPYMNDQNYGKKPYGETLRQNAGYQMSHSSSMPQMPQMNQLSQVQSHSYGEAPYQQHQQGQRFRDYFEERTNKFQDHIKSNFDGGQQFFKVQDAYQQKKMKQTQNYADFLRKQLQQKEYVKMAQKEKENMEQIAHREMQAYQMALDKQKYMRENEIKNYQNMVQAQEVELQRQRRQRKSKQFQYNNVSYHNPITNPIEYHIDNPYILKKIQDKTIG